MKVCPKGPHGVYMQVQSTTTESLLWVNWSPNETLVVLLETLPCYHGNSILFLFCVYQNAEPQRTLCACSRCDLLCCVLRNISTPNVDSTAVLLRWYMRIYSVHIWYSAFFIDATLSPSEYCGDSLYVTGVLFTNFTIFFLVLFWWKTFILDVFLCKIFYTFVAPFWPPWVSMVWKKNTYFYLLLQWFEGFSEEDFKDCSNLFV